MEETALDNAIRQVRRIFLGVGVFALFINILMLTGPLYMLQIYDRVLISQSIPTLIALTLLVVGLYLTLGLLDWLRGVIFNKAASGFEDALAEEAFDREVHALMRERRGVAPDLPGRLRSLRRFLSGNTLPAIFDAPFSPLFFVILFILHWAYGAWALFGTIILIALAYANTIFNSKSLAEAENLERKTQGQLTEVMRNLETLEAMGMRGQLRDRWRGQLDQSDAAVRGSGNGLAAFSATTKVTRLFLQSAILGLGAWLSILGESTPGAMIAASIIMGRAITPIQQLVTQWRSVVSARLAWGVIKEEFGKPGARDVQLELPPIKGRVTMENVHAAPPGQRDPTLRQINLDLEAGEMLGVLGPSGSGKSSLARVIIGIWPAIHGTVRIDGAEIASYQRGKLGPQIGYLPQQVDLMAGSVQDNIARFNPQPDAESVLAAARAAACHELVLSLPDGYDTEIGPGGCYLSAGQRQRVGLARALYGSPKLVVLDEPNSNLDHEGEAALLTALRDLKSLEITTIIIAHRPQAIRFCDKLAVLKEGMVAAFGPRDEVLPKIVPQAVRPEKSPNVARTAQTSEAGNE